MSALAIDTATEACSAALLHEGQVYHRFEVAPREHAQLILPMLDDLLEESGSRREDIEWIAFGQGPGAFTGVRIAAGIAHGLAEGLDCGLMPVSTLAAMARHRLELTDSAGPVLAALDARMREVYWGVYEVSQEHTRSLTEERVCPPESVNTADVELAHSVGIGPGWASYPDALEEALGGQPPQVFPEQYPDARHMLEIARQRLAAGESLQSCVEAQPVYLRDNVAKPSAK